MSFDVDEDILQDFLVEAGEILEQLQEQLVDLENNPGDKDLLNAIFRGYHTVKGGAGFLSLTELVEICHGAENVFDVTFKVFRGKPSKKARRVRYWSTLYLCKHNFCYINKRICRNNKQKISSNR